MIYFTFTSFCLAKSLLYADAQNRKINDLELHERQSAWM